MTKKDRKIIFNKYGGRCAYCGDPLKTGWHSDHVLPVNRLSKVKPGYYRHNVTKEKIHSSKDLPANWWKDYEHIPPKQVFDKMQYPDRDTVENSIPACASCNLYKSTMDLETFREQIGLLVGRLNKKYTQYKIAKRFGLIQETGIGVKFYFETLTKAGTGGSV